jgi:sushi domain-containing protein 2
MQPKPKTNIVGEVFFTRYVVWIVILIILLVILPMIMCIVCVVYQYRKKQLEKDPNYALPFPHSRSGSRTTLKNINSDTSDMGDDTSIRKVRRYDQSYDTHEPLKNKPAVDFDPTKKMDLDEDDVTSSEGSSLRDVKAKEFEYLTTPGSGAQDQRQLGRRSERLASDYKPIEEEDSRYPPPPIESPQPYNGSTYSPTFSNLDRTSYLSDPNQSPTPTGAIRVLPLNQQPSQPLPGNSRFYGEPSRSPPLTQNVGLPRGADGRSTEV